MKKLLIAGLIVTVIGIIVLTAGFVVLAKNPITLTSGTYESEVTFETIKINVVSSNVTIQKGDKLNIAYSHYDTNNFSITENGSTLEIKDNPKGLINYPFFLDSPKHPSVVVTIPYETDYFIKTVSGDVTLLNIESSTLDVKTTSGDVYIGDSKLSSLNVKSVSGDIKLNNSNPTNIVSYTVSGDMDFTNVTTGNIDVKSTSGDISFENFKSEINFYIGTISGDVTFRLSTVNSGRIDGVSTDVRISNSNINGVVIDLVSGDVKYD